MRHRVERAGLWLVVAGVHALLLLALRESTQPRPRGEAPVAQRAPLVVRLIAALPRPATPAAKPPATRPPLQAPHARASTVEPPRAALGQAITLAPPAPDGAAPAASVPRAAAKLDLGLPPRVAGASAPRSMREQMLNDPRSNSPRATVESRVAAVAGSVDIVEERMDATRMRVRQRGACVEVHVSRNAQIDPFNQSVSPTPKIVKPC